MRDEIKEILDYFRKYMTIDDCIRLNKIEDYITNLQEENMKLITQLEDRAYEQIKFQWKDYKSRNEEAIDFIEEKISSTKGVVDDYMYHKEHNKILIELLREDIELYKKELNILTGSDKE